MATWTRVLVVGVLMAGAVGAEVITPKSAGPGTTAG